jgi:hypothetical protein
MFILELRSKVSGRFTNDFDALHQGQGKLAITIQIASISSQDKRSRFRGRFSHVIEARLVIDEHIVQPPERERRLGRSR